MSLSALHLFFCCGVSQNQGRVPLGWILSVLLEYECLLKITYSTKFWILKLPKEQKRTLPLWSLHWSWEGTQTILKNMNTNWWILWRLCCMVCKDSGRSGEAWLTIKLRYEGGRRNELPVGVGVGGQNTLGRAFAKEESFKCSKDWKKSSVTGKQRMG